MTTVIVSGITMATAGPVGGSAANWQTATAGGLAEHHKAYVSCVDGVASWHGVGVMSYVETIDVSSGAFKAAVSLAPKATVSVVLPTGARTVSSVDGGEPPIRLTFDECVKATPTTSVAPSTTTTAVAPPTTVAPTPTTTTVPEIPATTSSTSLPDPRCPETGCGPTTVVIPPTGLPETL